MRPELNMNMGKAQYLLTRDLLFDFVIKSGHRCFRCGGLLTRDTFSIEHKENWRFSEYGSDLYFDLNNIAYSHKKCNYSAARKTKSPCGTRTKYKNGCRCKDCVMANSEYKALWYTKERRHNYYIKYNC